MVCSQEVSFDQDWSWNHFHLVGRRNMSFGRASKHVIWSGVEIYHVVGRRNMSFGEASKTSHLVGRRNISVGLE